MRTPNSLLPPLTRPRTSQPPTLLLPLPSLLLLLPLLPQRPSPSLHHIIPIFLGIRPRLILLRTLGTRASSPGDEFQWLDGLLLKLLCAFFKTAALLPLDGFGGRQLFDYAPVFGEENVVVGIVGWGAADGSDGFFFDNYGVAEFLDGGGGGLWHSGCVDDGGVLVW